MYEKDLIGCNADFIECILTSDEVLMGLAAGAITAGAVVAILEPTPAGEAALASALIAAGVIEAEAETQESPHF